jgi:hypothetical protein
MRRLSAVVLALVVLGCRTAPAPPTPTSPPTQAPSPSPAPTASASPSPPPGPAAIHDGEYTIASLLALLPVAPESGAGYDRALFRHWIKTGTDGCDTRRRVLIRDATVAPRVGAACRLSGGQWFSLYDGLTFTDARRLDIDHVVPLAEAWRSGASSWDPSEREAYANDLGIAVALLAVSASSNRQKGDRDPADWVPSRTVFLCTYLADWLAVKARWELTVDQRERSAIARESQCANTPVEVNLAN